MEPESPKIEMWSQGGRPRMSGMMERATLMAHLAPQASASCALEASRSGRVHSPMGVAGYKGERINKATPAPETGRSSRGNKVDPSKKIPTLVRGVEESQTGEPYGTVISE
jgi:hypothetical protein